MPAGAPSSAPPVLAPVAVVTLGLVGANAQAAPIGQSPLAGTVNYLLGSDPTGWHTNIPTFGRVAYANVYPGVDLVYHGDGDRLEYDFQLAAGADPAPIRLAIGGASGVRLDGKGNLVLEAAGRALVEDQPRVYQTVGGVRQPVAAHYILLGNNQVGFALGAYDTTTPLNIDPVLQYGTYLGGSDYRGFGMAVDGTGNAYLVGYGGFGDNYPVTAGGFQQHLKGGFDTVISKVNAAGTGLVYSTYLGGSVDDLGQAIAIDASGDAFVAGYTASADFPTTAGAAQRTYGGGTYDAFVTELNSSGSGLVYSTYLGGSAEDRGQAIALDAAGNAFVAGLTYSGNFPGPGGTAPKFGNGGLPSGSSDDAFVTSLTSTGTIRNSLYLGGGGNDEAYGEAIDSGGNVYLTGLTGSTDFPLNNALQGTNKGGNDAFVAKLSNQLNTLLYSTYLGGSEGDDEGRAIAVDSGGNMYVAGFANGASFPTTAGSYQAAYTGAPGTYDAFLGKLNSAGSGLVYGTYLGGSNDTYALALALDGAGDAYLAGDTYAADFPVAGNLQNTIAGGDDAFVAELSASGGSLLLGTYLGGTWDDRARGVAVAGGSVYAMGITGSDTFPTLGAYQGANGGSNNLWLAKLGTAAGSAASSGDIPWHPHYSARLFGWMGARVDLADGHVDVGAADLGVAGRGPDLALGHTWDSTRAAAGQATWAGQGWSTDLTPYIAGSPGGTVTYLDETGATWRFPFSGGAYQTPAGLPWQLTASANAFTLTNILTGATRGFAAQANGVSKVTVYPLASVADSYGNADTLAYSNETPITDTNSGGRALTLGYTHGLLTDVQSPLWRSSGGTASTPGSQGQHVAYTYSGEQLTAIARGALSSDAATAHLGYTGDLLTSVTTPMTMSGGLAVTRTWGLGYDGQNRLTTITSPISGTVGQPGYTPAYTTQIAYSAGQTAVTEGYGTANAIATTYSLDGGGRATAVADALGHTRRYSYDGDNDVTTSQDGNGNTTTYHYQYIGPNSAYGQLTEADLPAIRPLYPSSALTAPASYFVYNATTHDLTEAYDSYGAVAYYGYDTHHQMTSTARVTSTSAGMYHWRGTIMVYDPYGEPTSQIDGRGVTVPDTTGTTTAPSVTANGSAASYTHGWTYAPQGDKQTSATPPITTTLNGTTSTTPATTTYGYDGDGNPTSERSPNGNSTQHVYNRLDRLINTTLPDILIANDVATATPRSTIAYDGDGNVGETKNGNDDVVMSSYDPLGRLVSQTNAISGTTLLAYTSTNRASQRDPAGNVTQYQYDAAGRRTSQVDAAGQTRTYGYDAADNPTTVAYGDGTTTVKTLTRTFDALNQPSTEAVSGPGLASPLTTTYSYDLHGNLVREQHPNGDVTFNGYDLVDQLVGRELDTGNPNTPAGTHRETFAYDAAGNPISQVDFRGATKTLTVDGDNRATQEVDSFAGSPTITISLTYDPDGNLLFQTQNDGTTTHTMHIYYNAADWPTRHIDDGQSTYHTGDGAGRQVAFSTDPGTIATDPDNQGRWQTLKDDAANTTSFGYNPNDLPTSYAYPGGASQVLSYDGASRLTQATIRGTGGPALRVDTYGYGYDGGGRTISATTSAGGGAATTQAIAHDAEDRLTASSGGASTGAWQYDGHGNLTQRTVNGTAAGYSYDTANANELSAVTVGGQPTVAYSYDRQGHATGITDNSTFRRTLSYDAQGRLANVALGTTGAVTETVALSYNAQGLRATYTVTPTGAAGPSLIEQFHYRGTELAQVDYSGSGIALRYTDTYLYRQDGAPLEVIRLQPQQGKVTSRYWYVLDGRKDVVALTDAAGGVVDQYAYDLWGRPTAIAESVPQQLRYAGYWYDNELGWYWLRVRSYDPALERFLQPDPSEIEGLFSYVYAQDDPIDSYDPSGLETQIVNSDKTMDNEDDPAGVVEDAGEGGRQVAGLQGASTTQCASQQPDLQQGSSPAVHVTGVSGCNIQIRFNPVRVPMNNNQAYHAYIIVQNTLGVADPYYFRGGPGGPGCTLTVFGCVKAQGGKYDYRSPDWVPDYKGPIVTVYNGPIPCSEWTGLFTQLVPAINNGKNRYNPLGKNSNSTVYTLLAVVGLDVPKDRIPVLVPGWGIFLRLVYPDPGVQQ